MTCRCQTEVYSRVVGYYRPVQQWNKGKQAEYADRLPFKLAGGPDPSPPRNAGRGAKGSLLTGVGEWLGMRGENDEWSVT